MLSRIIAGCLIGIALISMLAHAQEHSVAIVIVTHAGKTIKGELVDADENHLRYKPNPKTDEIASIDWTDIKRVSNGITRQKVIDDIKKLLPDRVCDPCHGDGKLDCSKCHGTGVDPASAMDCDQCKGVSTLGKCPKCKEGKIPCTERCIKHASFEGKPKDAEGKRWMRVKHTKGNGYTNISDAHIGEIYVFNNDGSVNLLGKCAICDGTALIQCTLCKGKATRDCPKCIAGKTGPACSDCKEGKVECKDCSGVGLKKKSE